MISTLTLLRILFSSIGIVTNLAAFLIFSRKKLTKYSSINLYRINCISDLMASSIITLIMVLNKILNLVMTNRFVCKFVSTIVFWPANSIWIIVYISFDRMILILFPKRFPALKKRKTQYIICGSIFAYIVVLYFPLSWQQDYMLFTQYEIIGNITFNYSFMSCTVETLEIFLIVTTIDMINSSILPFVLMFTCSIITVIYLFRARNNTHNNSRNNAHNSVQAKKEWERLKKDIHFTITSIALNLAALLFTLPMQVPFLFKDIIEMDPVINLWFVILFNFGYADRKSVV